MSSGVTHTKCQGARCQSGTSVTLGADPVLSAYLSPRYWFARWFSSSVATFVLTLAASVNAPVPFLGIVGCVGEFLFGVGLDVGLFATLTAALVTAPETGGLTFVAAIVDSQLIAAGFAVGVYAILDAITNCN